MAQRILSTLPEEDYLRLVPNLHSVDLPLGEVVYESSVPMDHVYFPTTCVISLLHTMSDGSIAEMGIVGNEGMVGIALFLGGVTTPNRALVQVAGEALRLSSRVLREEFTRLDAFHDCLLRYTQALITQISQTAVCNRLHSVEQRLCRWLLLSHDRVPSDEIAMTQEFIATMLGGRRESVAIAAGHLQGAGLIYYSRGHIRILDRKGLEQRVCECYGVVKVESDRLLGTSGKPFSRGARSQ
ncbi:MAG: Crp/Fnr family transcriptional regulator [Bryobacteraceae bacterium]